MELTNLQARETYRASRSRLLWVVLLLLILTLLGLCGSMMVGSARMPISSFLEAVKGKLNGSANPQDANQIIIWNIRLPRALMAYCVGAALSISGVAMQGIFKNPMAEPHLLGVSSGAALGAALAMIVPIGTGGLLGLSWVSLGALLGGAGAALLVMALSGNGRGSVVNLLLSGIAVGAFLTAMLSGILTLNHDKMEAVYTWTMGSFAAASMQKLSFIAPVLLGAGILMRVYARDLNAMLLGDDEARSLGVSATKSRLVLLIASTLLTAIAVSLSGIIGFVGLMVPHGVRLVVGADHRRVVPVSLFAGGLYLMLMDTLARTVFMPTELPVGVLTALVGGPFFLSLLRRARLQNGGGL